MSAASAVAGEFALSGVPAEAFAQPTGAASEKIWSTDDWAQKGDVKLYMFRKRLLRRRGEAGAACVVSRAWVFHFFVII